MSAWHVVESGSGIDLLAMLAHASAPSRWNCPYLICILTKVDDGLGVGKNAVRKSAEMTALWLPLTLRRTFT